MAIERITDRLLRMVPRILHADPLTEGTVDEAYKILAEGAKLRRLPGSRRLGKAGVAVIDAIKAKQGVRGYEIPHNSLP